VVKDLNGMSAEEFLEALKQDFDVEKKGTDIYSPEALHVFALYLQGEWYKLTAKAGRYDDNDPIGVLDVTISSNLILDKLLGIKDLRSDKRIDFVGGIRGLGELKRRVDSGEMEMALALYPVTMKQLIDKTLLQRALFLYFMRSLLMYKMLRHISTMTPTEFESTSDINVYSFSVPRGSCE
jgi:uncharacterized protein (DUF1015 family)